MTMLCVGKLMGFKVSAEKTRTNERYNKMVIGVGYTDVNGWGQTSERVHELQVGQDAHDVAQKFCNANQGKIVRIPFFIGQSGTPFIAGRSFEPDVIEVI